METTVTRYNVLSLGRFVRSFDTRRRALDWIAHAPWPYSGHDLTIEAEEVQTHFPALLGDR